MRASRRGSKSSAYRRRGLHRDRLDGRKWLIPRTHRATRHLLELVLLTRPTSRPDPVAWTPASVRPANVTGDVRPGERKAPIAARPARLDDSVAIATLRTPCRRTAARAPNVGRLPSSAVMLSCDYSSAVSSSAASSDFGCRPLDEFNMRHLRAVAAPGTQLDDPACSRRSAPRSGRNVVKQRAQAPCGRSEPLRPAGAQCRSPRLPSVIIRSATGPDRLGLGFGGHDRLVTQAGRSPGFAPAPRDGTGCGSAHDRIPSMPHPSTPIPPDRVRNQPR